MERAFCVLALILTLGCANTVYAQADAPPSPVLAYQGHLSESNLLVDGMRPFVFSIVDSSGIQLWKSGTQSVPVKGGLYSILLGGSGMPAIPASLMDRANLHLQVTVDGVQLSPDVPLIPALQALTAWNVNGPFGGDVSGMQKAISVDKLKGTPIDLTTAPSSGEVLTFNGSSWVAASAPTGAQGAVGPVGAQGPAGPAGAQGLAGKDGATGSAGQQGPAGAQGLAGKDGATGPAGPQGPQGPIGTAMPAVVLTDGPAITTNAALGNHFRVTLGGNRSLSAPTGMIDGQKVTWEFIQDATGSRTLAFNSAFAFGTDVTGCTLTTTANKRDFVGAIYNATTSLWYVVSCAKGY